MANKQKQSTEKETVQETWRKPLQVPPRSNAMRAFYQGSEENAPPAVIEPDENPVLESSEETAPVKLPQKEKVKSAEKKTEKGKADAKFLKEANEFQVVREKAHDSITKQSDKMSAEELTDFLGFEIEDLFDVNELLRGKSLEMYQILIRGRDEKGRYKITQPELMKRTGIKNRRTFYKHEQWLINLRLLEKRHLPGDHKGVVYRIFEISEVLPVPSELMEQFERMLKDPE